MRCTELILAMLFKVGCNPVVSYNINLVGHDQQLKNKIEIE